MASIVGHAGHAVRTAAGHQGPTRLPLAGPTGRGRGTRTRPRRADWTPPGRPGRPARTGRASNHEPSASRTRPSRVRIGRPPVASGCPGHGQCVGRDVGGPDLEVRDSRAPPSAARDRAMAPEPVPRSTQTGGRRPAVPESGRSARRGQLRQRHLHHLLGLGPGDEDPSVDLQLERAERPGAEHVLQGLAGGPAAGRPGPRRRSPRRRARRSSGPPAPSPAGPAMDCSDRPARGPVRRRLGRVGSGRHRHGLTLRPAGGTACRPSARRSARRGRPSGCGRACAGSA